MNSFKDNKFLAFDLGASSGRAIVGSLNKKRILNLDILYRFPNDPVQINNSLYWNIVNLIKEMKKALSLFVESYGIDNVNLSIGIDTWGVDFVLLNEKDEPVGFVHHYRDKRTIGIIEEMIKIVPKEEIFTQTGVQFSTINTSTQLYSMVYNRSPELSITKTILMFPDYLNFILSGVKCSEFSISTTTQLFNPIKGQWAYDLIEKLGLKQEWFCRIVDPGTIIGTIQEYIANEIGLSKGTKIIAPLCHDTGSAVIAVPVNMDRYKEGEWAYLSSGTWSLIGIELKKPLINEKVFRYNFTNEGGINKSIRFLKNLTGMWLIQECKRIWDNKGLNLTWKDIDIETKQCEPFKNFINVDDPSFIHNSNMVQAIKKYCKKYNQNPPETVGQISRTIFESLAFKYKKVIKELEEIINKKIKILYIVGGGSQNRLLNQFTANALNIKVKSGPKEATAIGNILVQALALGKIKNLSELRQIVKKSFMIDKYIPRNIENWKDAYKSYLQNTK